MFNTIAKFIGYLTDFNLLIYEKYSFSELYKNEIKESFIKWIRKLILQFKNLKNVLNKPNYSYT